MNFVSVDHWARTSPRGWLGDPPESFGWSFGRSSDLRVILVPSLPSQGPVHMTVSSPLTAAGAVPDLHRVPSWPLDERTEAGTDYLRPLAGSMKSCGGGHRGICDETGTRKGSPSRAWGTRAGPVNSIGVGREPGDLVAHGLLVRARFAGNVSVPLGGFGRVGSFVMRERWIWLHTKACW